MGRRLRQAMMAIVIMLLPVAVGCGEVVRQMDSMEHKSAVKTLTVGMSRADLKALLGKPAKRENYGNTEFMIYETNYLSFSSEGRFTPIAVVGGKVVGWGQEYYAAVVKAQSAWNSDLDAGAASSQAPATDGEAPKSR